jgi:uncharacterized protein (TIGR03435 family)
LHGLGTASAAIAVLLASSLAAQSTKSEFSVASIKPSRDNECPCRLDILPGGVLRGTHVTLERILQLAYRRPTGNLRTDLILGAPEWARFEKFDLEAKADASATPEQIALMLRQLLEDRFKLRAALELREREVYVLRRKRTNAVGPDLRQKTGAACANAGGAGQPLAPTSSIGGRLWFGRVCATPGDLVSNLSALLKADVFDETGLTGTWDYVVTYPQDAATGVAGPNDLSLIPLAIDRNLGLTVAKERREIQILAVKSVERPTAN